VTRSVGIMFANGARSAEPDHAAALARFAKSAGDESLWSVEHIVVPVERDYEYPDSQSGTIPGGPCAPVPERLVWLAIVTVVTTRIRLCGGRLGLGVGAGWLREEFDAVGPPSTRAARARTNASASCAVRGPSRWPSPTGRRTRTARRRGTQAAGRHRPAAVWASPHGRRPRRRPGGKVLSSVRPARHLQP
jgi:alkanesulfonate monooxygenase SsuD/methylene tetrahydromethanopterin reductase-like flavin-dependent oxidoreductase (luciferase family)